MTDASNFPLIYYVYCFFDEIIYFHKDRGLGKLYVNKVNEANVSVTFFFFTFMGII